MRRQPARPLSCVERRRGFPSSARLAARRGGSRRRRSVAVWWFHPRYRACAFGDAESRGLPPPPSRVERPAPPERHAARFVPESPTPSLTAGPPLVSGVFPCRLVCLFSPLLFAPFTWLLFPHPSHPHRGAPCRPRSLCNLLPPSRLCKQHWTQPAGRSSLCVTGPGWMQAAWHRG